MYIAVALVWLRWVDGIPLTRWDIGGAAIALMLPHVVRWYQEAWQQEGTGSGLLLEGNEPLDARLRDLAAAAELPRTLRDASVSEGVLPRLADEAAAEWVARYSPRALDSAAAHELYRAAW